MKEEKVTLQNPSGLHARPGKELVQLAKKYESEIVLEKDGQEFNAKSLMKLLQAGFVQNDAITVKANGSDESEAIDAIVNYINNLEE